MAPPDISNQILDELKALRSELGEMRATVIGTSRDAGLGEQIRESRADRQRLWEEIADVRIQVAGLEARVQTIERLPGRKALQWVEVLALGLVVTGAGGLGALVWADLHPAAAPPSIQEPARVAGPAHPHR